MENSFSDFLKKEINDCLNMKVNQLIELPDTKKIRHKLDKLQSFLYDVDTRYIDDGDEFQRISLINKYYWENKNAAFAAVYQLMVNKLPLPDSIVSSYNEAVTEYAIWLETKNKYCPLDARVPERVMLT